jgi:hypothetical protein
MLLAHLTRMLAPPANSSVTMVIHASIPAVRDTCRDRLNLVGSGP